MPVSALPAKRPSSPLHPTDATAAQDVGRVFADDGSLFDSVRERYRAFVEDLRQPEQRHSLIQLAALTALLMFSYWPGLLSAKAAWNNPQYSHGWIVPLFSVAILFWWRQPIRPVSLSAQAAGLGLLVASLAIRLFVARYRIITIDMYTFVPALAGVALLSGGWSMFRWAWALPDEATRYLLGPLQTMATMVSTYAIQTLGVDAIREGNQIIVGKMHLGVVDACSGLRMLTIFIALSVAIVMLGDMEWYESLVILASAVPIALTVNAIRITLTGVMYTIDPAIAEKIFHDWAGYFMMPLALALLYLLQKLLSMLLVVDDMALVPIAPLGGAGAGGVGNAGDRNRPVLRTAGVDLRSQPAHSGDRPRSNSDQKEPDAG
jgi:exosortase